MVIQFTIAGLLRLIGYSIWLAAIYTNNVPAGLLAMAAITLLWLITPKKLPAK